MTRKTQKTFQPGRGYTKEDWDEVGDSPEWTAEDFAKAQPFAKVFPDLAASIRRGRGAEQGADQETGVAAAVARVIDKYKADGDGWQCAKGISEIHSVREGQVTASDRGRGDW